MVGESGSHGGRDSEWAGLRRLPPHVARSRLRQERGLCQRWPPLRALPATRSYPGLQRVVRDPRSPSGALRGTSAHSFPLLYQPRFWGTLACPPALGPWASRDSAWLLWANTEAAPHPSVGTGPLLPSGTPQTGSCPLPGVGVLPGARPVYSWGPSTSNPEGAESGGPELPWKGPSQMPTWTLSPDPLTTSPSHGAAPSSHTRSHTHACGIHTCACTQPHVCAHPHCCMLTCLCICTCVHPCVHTSTAPTGMHARVHYSRTCAHSCAPLTQVCARAPACTLMCTTDTRVHTLTSMHARVHYRHACAHTPTCTYTHRPHTGQPAWAQTRAGLGNPHHGRQPDPHPLQHPSASQQLIHTLTTLTCPPQDTAPLPTSTKPHTQLVLMLPPTPSLGHPPTLTSPSLGSPTSPHLLDLAPRGRGHVPVRAPSPRRVPAQGRAEREGVPQGPDPSWRAGGAKAGA